MPSVKRIALLVLLASLTVSQVACDGREATSEPEPTEVTQLLTDTPVRPTVTPEPSDTPELAEEPTALEAETLARPDTLESFRSSLSVSVEGTTLEGSKASAAWEILVEFVRDPPARHMRLKGDFPGFEGLGVAGDRTFDVYVVGDTVYANLFGEWSRLEAASFGTADLEDMPFGASQAMIQDLAHAEYKGTKTYDGIRTRHYSFDETSFDAETLNDTAIKEAIGNVYVAVEGNFLVHMDVNLTAEALSIPSGSDQVIHSGTMEIIVDFYDMNEPFTIELPEGALSSG